MWAFLSLYKTDRIMTKGYGICLNEWIEDLRIKNELRLLIKISSLTADKGYCFASNEHFSDYFGIDVATVSRQIKKLESLGYLKIEYERRGAEIKKRFIRLTKMSFDDCQESHSTNDQNVKDNNTSINSTSINKKESKDSKKPPSSDGYTFEEFWEEYNHKVGKQKAQQKFNKLTDKQKELVKKAVPLYKKDTVTEDLKGANFKPMRKHASSWLHEGRYFDYEGVEDKSTELAKEFLKTGICMPKEYLEIFGMTEDELRALYRKSVDYASQEGFDNFKVDYIKKKYSLD